MMGMKLALTHLSQFEQNTLELYRPRIVRGNEINSALAINELIFTKQKIKQTHT